MQSSPRIDELKQKFHENPRRYFAPLANEYRKAGDPEQAIAICRAHLAQQPGHMSGHVVYGQALYDAGRIEEAAVVFQQALALDPENLIVLRHLGDIARRQGYIEEARNFYSRALDGDPQDAEVAAYLAELTEPVVVSPYAEVTTTAATSKESPSPDDSPYLEAAAPADGIEETTPAADSKPELSAEAALEAEAAATDMEAEGAPAPASTEAERAPERPSRTTPAFETTPIVTRTLAELYLQQGYIEPALEIYRQLAEREPDNAGLRARITELSREAVERDRESEGTHPPAPTAQSVSLEESAPPKEAEVADEQPSAELWDTADSWGAADFNESEDADEIFGLSGMSDAPLAASVPEEAEPETSSWDILEDAAKPVDTALPEVAAPQPPEAKTPAVEVPPDEKPEEHAPPAAIEPRGITIREFFATLGAMRPPGTRSADDENDDVTSLHGADVDAVPAPATSGGEEGSYQYADDAFAKLFGNAPVSAEDSRAAAALSGAVAHAAPAATVTASTGFAPERAGASPAAAQPVQESEEDVRRFREWLEGLASS